MLIKYTMAMHTNKHTHINKAPSINLYGALQLLHNTSCSYLRRRRTDNPSKFISQINRASESELTVPDKNEEDKRDASPEVLAEPARPGSQSSPAGYLWT